MGNVKGVATIFGVVFVAIGILGLVPVVTVNNMLLGLFMVDPVHNIIHLVTGVLAFVVANKMEYAKLYFKVFGVIYAIVAIVGFFNGGNVWIMHVNVADNFLHLVVALVALYVGFVEKTPAASA